MHDCESAVEFGYGPTVASIPPSNAIRPPKQVRRRYARPVGDQTQGLHDTHRQRSRHVSITAHCTSPSACSLHHRRESRVAPLSRKADAQRHSACGLPLAPPSKHRVREDRRHERCSQFVSSIQILQTLQPLALDKRAPQARLLPSTWWNSTHRHSHHTGLLACPGGRTSCRGSSAGNAAIGANQGLA